MLLKPLLKWVLNLTLTLMQTLTPTRYFYITKSRWQVSSILSAEMTVATLCVYQAQLLHALVHWKADFM